MNKEIAIRLAAWFDGELPPADEQAIASLLESDPEARAYLEELKRTRAALHGASVQTIEGDAAWESLRERLDNPVRERSRNILVFPKYATAAAAILALGMGIWWPLRKSGDTTGVIGLESSVYMVETEIENATPVVYIDEPSGWTVVWILEDEPPNQG